MMKGRETFPFLLKRNNLIGAEVGVETGVFSKYLLETNLFEKLYSIDPWDSFIPGTTQHGKQFYSSNSEETYMSAKNLLKIYGEKSNILRMKSQDAAKDFENEYFDFIFLDGDHTEAGVKTDLYSWWSKVKKGGVLSGHDYFDLDMVLDSGIISNFGVKTAVDAFVKENNLQLYIVEEETEALDWRSPRDLPKWNSWYILK